jgi:ATP-binding cassette subfamily B protein
LSQCDGFVEKLPNTVNYEIFEDGGVLSQGEKQLLCIARLMLRNKPIIILDEATSNVDTRTELKIQAAFDSLLKNKTSFIVAHRLSTIQSADLILVLDGGKIVESGKHSELLKNKGFYYNLYQSQFES